MVELQVCIGGSCHKNGANNVVMSFKHLIEEYGLHEKIDFATSLCMGNCRKEDVSVRLNGEVYGVSPTACRKFFREKVLPLIK